jgi:uncharacterized surface protein with fasciclin (FAS1) repeats
MNRFTFKTLAEAVETAGLSEALSGTTNAPSYSLLKLLQWTLIICLFLSTGGKITVFAPHDNAFLEYFDATKQTKEAFLADKEKLANLLKYHVVDGIHDGKELLTCGKLSTLNGADVLSVVDKTGRAFMNDEAKVETTDNEADNGIFHIIDFPLTPPKK